jgi:hypothetical protein
LAPQVNQPGGRASDGPDDLGPGPDHHRLVISCRGLDLAAGGAVGRLLFAAGS